MALIDFNCWGKASTANPFLTPSLYVVHFCKYPLNGVKYFIMNEIEGEGFTGGYQHRKKSSRELKETSNDSKSAKRILITLKPLYSY
jgi:hypothetical protein